MPAIAVPDLRRKFALLRAYSARTSWDLLAAPFGKSPKTLKYWCHGSASRDPDQMPPEALPMLIALFAEVLPGDRPDDDVRRLALGAADRLEAEIRAGAGSSFARLIAEEGQAGTAILVTKPEESHLVEIDREAMAGIARISLGAWFRIEFPVTTGCRHAVTLQGVQRIWAATPSAMSESSPRRVLMPGLSDKQEPRFMRERRDIGLHRFVCLQTAEPFPVPVEAYWREDSIFDKRGLDDLAGFYTGLPPSKRASHVLTVSIEPGPAL